ncbi:hypothetical protein KW850_14650 [Bacillus sp. sid0103]|uniref:hypothetical protein n=1 Tax=Bacillus sp. sid0103 TaxID=2856337 RepID=UPI001C46A3E5|nr:hypothetical protein [Bacillus sp. sid0103]MBV7506501.1 hypothetical protein [Bacillus sp. sid0103]
MHLWYIFLLFGLGAFCFIISNHFKRDQEHRNLLEKSEKKYQDLIKKYKALENKNLHLEKQIQEEKERTSMIEQVFCQPLNSLSLLIQDVREAHEFGEIDDHYIGSFTRESMQQIKLMSQSINDIHKKGKPNEEKTLI